MTNKEAIWRINDHMIVHHLNEPKAIKITEALQKAIKALEEKPCIDCVSREDALKELCNNTYSKEFCAEHNIDWSINLEMAQIVINRLPTVQPKSPWIRIEFKGDALNCPLPDDGERVFLRFKNGYVTTDTCQVTIDEEDNTCYGFEDNPDFEDIDAWMRIPE